MSAALADVCLDTRIPRISAANVAEWPGGPVMSALTPLLTVYPPSHHLRQVRSCRALALLEGAQNRSAGFYEIDDDVEVFAAITDAIRDGASAGKSDVQIALAFRPVIEEIQASGATTWRAIAAALNERGIPTARGDGEWSSTQVGRILAALAT